MFHSFNQILDTVLEKKQKKKIAIAAAEDEDVIQSVIEAYNKQIIEPVFVGDGINIEQILKEMGYKPSLFKIINTTDKNDSARHVAEMMYNKEIDIPMKGLLQTADFLKAILNKEFNLIPPNGLISQATVCQYNDKMVIISDCAINIFPDIENKRKIINNAVFLAHKLEIDIPKVAILAPVETVNSAIPVTLEASVLSKMEQRRQIEGAIVDGPLALDNAISEEAAHHKNINSKVAGNADILIVPDLMSGNIMHKTITYFANLPTAGTVLGAKFPIIMTSRTDNPIDKFNSVLIAVLMAS